MVSIKDIEINIIPIKKAANEYEIEHFFDSIFDRAGLTYQAQKRILNGKPDCLIGDIIIDFKYNISKSQLNKWVSSKGRQYIQEYFNTHGKHPSLLIVVSEKNIFYFDKDIILREKRDVDKESILSLLECLMEPKNVDSEQFAILFGINSPLYILFYNRLEKHFDDHSGEKTVCFQQWKKHFRLAYHDEKVGKELFLRHSYLSTLLKLILYKEFINPPEYKKESFRDLEAYFEINGISLFHYDFFRWVINVFNFCDDLFTNLKIMTFQATDIFRTIYQEMIVAGVRHRLGEYYTPEILCKKMVKKSYILKDRILDSSCGSGTFLIETLKEIDLQFNLKPGEKPPEDWFKAVNNIFGFDINPIAVLTTKANIILFFKSRKQWLEKISINIYLCNSIDPIEFSPTADIQLGSFYKFCVELIDTELELRIPEEALVKENIEAFQKIIKKIYNVWEEFNEFEDTWEAVISALSSGLKNSFFSIIIKTTKISMEIALKQFFEKLYALKTQDKDHIWLYLLNNLVGIRLLLLKKKMDLIITNPPWLTYKDADPKLKENMKQISKNFSIKPDAKNVTNIEEAVIFLYKVPELYLKKDGKGKIAFVMPRSILVSSQNEEARRFDRFEDIEFYEFDDMIFNIECCCIFGIYSNMEIKNENVFNLYPIDCHYLDHKNMELIETYSLHPFVYFQKESGASYSVKKLIKDSERETLLPIYLSGYLKEFIQGADLLPKSLLYSKVLNTVEEGRISIINPWISPQAKGAWKKKYFNNVRIETECLFQATLSRQLYPFYIKPYFIFLPLNKDLKYDVKKLGPFSRKHWKNISEKFKKINKKDLFEVGINYRNKLCKGGKVRNTQKAKLKVVFPNAKKLMSAVIEDPDSRIYIDSTLYYYGTKNEKEAYYICGMLNTRELYKTVKVISDTRHHHKRPLYFNISKFSGTKEQIEIAKLAKECSVIVKDYVLNSDKPKEKEIYDIIEDKLDRIEELGNVILTSVDSQEIVKEYEMP